MYKYQCSKQDCATIWTLQEGSLNGFSLTCPICGKGRGLFIGQTRRELFANREQNFEEMTIILKKDMAKAVEQINNRLNELSRMHSVVIKDKQIVSSGDEVVCTIKYRKASSS